MNADVERAMNWLKGMADDRGYTEHLAHGGKGDPIKEQEIECASTALKYIESLQAQLAEAQRRAKMAVEDLHTLRKKSGWKCFACKYDTNYVREVCAGCDYNNGNNWQWRGDAEEEARGVGLRPLV
jgi:hypothetical protein